VKKQLPLSQGSMVKLMRIVVRADVRIDEKNLTILYSGVTVLEVGFSRPARFYLASLKHKTRFAGIKDVVIVPRLPILTNKFFGHSAVRSIDNK